ncbi:hypothetical protein LCGC14_2687200, partial [marine sediment metagenome]
DVLEEKVDKKFFLSDKQKELRGVCKEASCIKSSKSRTRIRKLPRNEHDRIKNSLKVYT